MKVRIRAMIRFRLFFATEVPTMFAIRIFRMQATLRSFPQVVR